MMVPDEKYRQVLSSGLLDEVQCVFYSILRIGAGEAAVNEVALWNRWKPQNL